MSAWSTRRLPAELVAEVNAGDVAVITEDDETTPMGIILPFPSDPDQRVREAASLLRAGLVGSETAARLAGCDGVSSFLERCGALQETIMGEDVLQEDLATASRLKEQLRGR